MKTKTLLVILSTIACLAPIFIVGWKIWLGMMIFGFGNNLSVKLASGYDKK
jgi:hypothetical protein